MNASLMSSGRLFVLTSFVIWEFCLLANVPSLISYQGRLSVDGTDVFDGPGNFKFALVDGGTNLHRQAKASATVIGGFIPEINVTDGGTGYVEAPGVAIFDPTGSNAVAFATISGGVVTDITVVDPGEAYSASPMVVIGTPPPDFRYVTHWSNDGSSTEGGEPAQAVPLHVSQGVFTVNLGDTSLSNMLMEIRPLVFTNADVRLRLWFSDGEGPFQQFYPDQRLTSAGYAMMAENVADGAVTAPKLATGAVGNAALTPDSVSTANVADSAITMAKLSPEVVSATRIPIGAVFAWLKSAPNTPPLPPEWAECNGQTVDDIQSPYHGQPLPNLNGHGGGVQRFLRGATTSGAVGGEDTHTLTVQEMPAHSHEHGNGYLSGQGTEQGIRADYGGSSLSIQLYGNDLKITSTGGGQAHENRPPFYEVVWIMKVK